MRASRQQTAPVTPQERIDQIDAELRSLQWDIGVAWAEYTRLNNMRGRPKGLKAANSKLFALWARQERRSVERRTILAEWRAAQERAGEVGNG